MSWKVGRARNFKKYWVTQNQKRVAWLVYLWFAEYRAREELTGVKRCRADSAPPLLARWSTGRERDTPRVWKQDVNSAPSSQLHDLQYRYVVPFLVKGAIRRTAQVCASSPRTQTILNSFKTGNENELSSLNSLDDVEFCLQYFYPHPLWWCNSFYPLKTNLGDADGHRCYLRA